MEKLPACPECKSEYTYEDRGLFVCPECAHEWTQGEDHANEDERVIKDANGNVLEDGDTVTIIKDLKGKREFISFKNRYKSKEYPLSGWRPRHRL